MRLIDADKLLEEFEPTGQYGYQYTGDAVISKINEQPTAFDIGEIIELLEEKSEEAFRHSRGGTWIETMNKGYVNGTDYAIKIIKSGRADEK